MFKTDDGIEVYENQIETLFIKYFSERDLEPGDKDIKTSKYNSAWKYIYNNLFKPDRETIRYNNKNSKINYDDIRELKKICEIYIDLCFEYNIFTGQYGFCRMTGISRDTLNSWKRGEYRGGEDGASSKYSDIVKNIDDCYQELHKNSLDDTTVGQITMANNDESVGLMYAEKAARAQAQANAIAKLSREEIAARYRAQEEFREKPELPEGLD